jgi:hypothetical protein
MLSVAILSPSGKTELLEKMFVKHILKNLTIHPGCFTVVMNRNAVCFGVTVW